MTKRELWDARYSGRELVWGAEPNRFVAAELGGAPVRGRALDLACGEGRNAIWLAERGWRVTAVDYSRVGIERAGQLASERGVKVDWICDDVTTWRPEPDAFALVIVLYLQLPPADWRSALAGATAGLAPGGALFMVGHARRNLRDGTGGPREADVLWEPAEVEAELTGLCLRVEEAVEVERPTDDGIAIDARIRATRPAPAA